MGLSVERTLDNGVTLDYWRVVRVDCITNGPRIIEVAGYTSQDKRLEEKNAIAQGSTHNVYVHTEFFEAEADNGGMSCEQAYEFLKTLDAFAQASDVVE